MAPHCVIRTARWGGRGPTIRTARATNTRMRAIVRQGAPRTARIRSRLCAVLEALRAHPGSEPLVIESDSQYAINCSSKWVFGWKKNGWKNSKQEPVKNAPIIKAIDAEISKRAGKVSFRWVKGHAGNAGNEKVDDLCTRIRRRLRIRRARGVSAEGRWQALLESPYARDVKVPADAQLLLDGEMDEREYTRLHGRRGGRSRARRAESDRARRRADSADSAETDAPADTAAHAAESAADGTDTPAGEPTATAGMQLAPTGLAASRACDALPSPELEPVL